MDKVKAHLQAEYRRPDLLVQLVGFDKGSTKVLTGTVRSILFYPRKIEAANPTGGPNSKFSLWVLEVQPPTERGKRGARSLRGEYLQMWWHQIKGFSPLLVTPWLDRTRTKDQFTIDLLETLGTKLFCGRSYRKELIAFLDNYARKDPTKVLTNVSVSDGGIAVSFADGRRATIPLAEFKRLAESPDIIWENVRIAHSRDYLEVGLESGKSVPVPWDVLREFVREEEAAHKEENRKLRYATSALLGRRTRMLREKRQMTQIDLAQKAHISRWTVIRLEKGRLLPKIGALERIAGVLDTSLASFLAP